MYKIIIFLTTPLIFMLLLSSCTIETSSTESENTCPETESSYRAQIPAIISTDIKEISEESTETTNASEATTQSSLSEITKDTTETTTETKTETKTETTNQTTQSTTQTTVTANTEALTTLNEDSQQAGNISSRIIIPVQENTKVYTSAYASIDLSNASDGYLFAKYTGTKSKAKLLIIKDNIKYTYNLNTNGYAEVFPLQLGSGKYTIIIGELISGNSYSVSLQQDVDVTISNSLLPFLYPNQQVNFNKNSLIVNKADELCFNKDSDIEKISVVFKYITNNIKYDKTLANKIINGSVTVYLPCPDNTLSTKKGICYDYAALFASMMRSQGIPCKLVMGYVGPQKLYHAWNEVYTKETGWITVDVKLASVGFNPLDTTFYASSLNTKTTAKRFSDSSYYRVSKFY